MMSRSCVSICVEQLTIGLTERAKEAVRSVGTQFHRSTVARIATTGGLKQMLQPR